MSKSEAKLPVELPVGGGPEKRAYVRHLFETIAPKYDALNRVLSLSLDQRWRRGAVRRLGWERAPAGTYLDLCAGTLDFGAMLARQRGFAGRVLGADFVPRMLRQGLHKSPRVAPVTADALVLPFADAAFDGAMCGWGLRNLMDLDAGLRETARVLKPGARLVVLETAAPPNALLRSGFRLWFDRVVPLVGRAVSNHKSAYSWLPASARHFPEPPVLADKLRAAGFREVTYDLLLGGATALHIATR